MPIEHPLIIDDYYFVKTEHYRLVPCIGKFVRLKNNVR